MTKLKDIYDKLLNKNLPVRQRFFTIIFLCGFVVGLSSTFVCKSLNTSEMAIMLSASMTVVFPFFALMGLIAKEHQDYIIIAALLIINFFTFPALYLSGGGIDCGIPSFIILGIALSLFLVKGRIGVIITAVECIWVLIVYYISWACPWILMDIPAYSMSPTGERDFTYNAIFSNAAIVCLALGVLAKILFKMYYTQHKTVEEAIEKVKRQAIIDPLTGMYNRRYMYTYLSEKVAEAKKNSSALSIALFDIDYFKKLNDTYGHLLGDDVLKAVSEIIKDSCKDDEIVARYGGEEFLLIMPGSDLEQAFNRANEIRKNIENTLLSDELPKDSPVTISGGVADLKDNYNEENLVNEADENLYFAKNSGRNQIRSQSEEGGTENE